MYMQICDFSQIDHYVCCALFQFSGVGGESCRLVNLASLYRCSWNCKSSALDVCNESHYGGLLWLSPEHKRLCVLEQKQNICGPSQPSVGGVTVSIVAFQAIDPGSTPGQRIFSRNFTIFYTSTSQKVSVSVLVTISKYSHYMYTSPFPHTCQYSATSSLCPARSLVSVTNFAKHLTEEYLMHTRTHTA